MSIIQGILRFIKKRYKVLIVVLVLLIGGLIYFLIPKDNKEELEQELITMGKEFYEDYYYAGIGKTLEERASFLENHKDHGLKVSLDTLSRYDTEKNTKKVEDFVNSETDKKCNKEKTMVIIYPKSPYEKEDYKIETILECGFE